MNLFVSFLRNALLGVLISITAIAVAQETGPKPGQQAPGFELKSLDGPVISLDSMLERGHVMLVFWEPQCVYCYMHIEELNALQKQYADRLTIAAINFLGAYEVEIRQYVQENNVQYTVLADRLKNIDVAEDYNVIGSPTIVLIAPSGKVLFYDYKIPPLAKWLD